MDYEVSYAGNVNPGTAVVTVAFKGNYTGTVTKTFAINAVPAPGPVPVPAPVPVNPDGDENDITTVAGMEKSITAMTNDGDPAGSAYAPILLMSKKQTNTSVKLTWKGVPGAEGYIIYGNRCGKGFLFQRLSSVAGNVRSLNLTGLLKGAAYKYTILAYRVENGQKKVIGTAKTVHVVTKGGKTGNYAKVTVNTKKLSLKAKKKAKIK